MASKNTSLVTMLEDDIQDLISLALKEDLGDGDVTSLFFVDEKERTEARIFSRDPAVVRADTRAEAILQ